VVYGGGPLLASPRVVTVTFPGDALATQLEAFGAGITGSAYWTAVTSDLTCGGTSPCVGAGTGTSAVASAAPGASYVDYAGGTPPSGQPANTLQPYLESLIRALPANQQPDANSLYVFYFPTSTNISLNGGQACTAFGAYHNTLSLNGQDVVYAVVPECAPRAGSNLSLLQEATFAASHEILEASSDAIISSTPGQPSGYAIDETHQSSFGFLDFGLGELGDLCVDELGLGQDRTTEGGFTVQRMWSVANAATGLLDPCVPSSGGVYFNAFPTVSALIFSDVGASVSFEVDALAVGSMGSWTIEVADMTGPLAGSSTVCVSFAVTGGLNGNNVGTGSVTSGDKVQVTATMLVDPSTLPENPGWGTGAVYSYNGARASQSTAGNIWPFIVMTQQVATQDGFTMTEVVPPHLAARMAAQARKRAQRAGLGAWFRDHASPLTGAR
jgi:hypothetical protein